MSIGSLVTSGPLVLAIPVAAAAGALTFLSPCCLPLVPGYLSYITGMSGTGGAGPRAGGMRAQAAGRAVAGTALFVLGFSFVFATYGFALGGLGALLRDHDKGLTQVL
ncbi:MAG: cytochrome c biogenesis protein CcdA, partial [Nocardiopsaceae bacterium]|nr:cytochrome c biogenesis protein CcdA [Nocardiopsaceae bacterium]